MRERVRHDDESAQVQLRPGVAPAGPHRELAPTEAVFDAAARSQEPGRGGGHAVGRAVDALHASAGNAAIAGLFAGRSAGSERGGQPQVRAGRSETIDRPVVQASLDDEAGAEGMSEGEASLPDETGATELGTGAPAAGPSWTKVGPPTSGSFSVSGTLREVANTLAARPEAGSETATSSRQLETWTPDGGSEEVIAARVTVKQEVELPTWTDRGKATRNQQAEWDRFHAAITTHEAGHVSTDKTSFAGTHSAMIGKSPADADTELTNADTKATTDNKAYDTTTNSGLNQGTGINANIDEVTKVP